MRTISILLAFLIVLVGASAQPIPTSPYQGDYSGMAFPDDQYQYPPYPGVPDQNQYPGDQYQSYPGVPDQPQYPGDQFPGQGPGDTGPVQYSLEVPAGAPNPVAPTSPLALALDVPSTPTSVGQAPAGEGVALMMVDETAAYSAPLGTGSQPVMAQMRSMSQMIMPPGVPASNRFYVSNAPQTVASCYFWGYLPTWLRTFYTGQIWGYEWYPDGHLAVQYLGFATPGWHKRWFQGDQPGWHILQYNCNGWSNYIYIYVY